MDYSQHRLPDRQTNRRGHSHGEYHHSRTGHRSTNSRQIIDESRHSHDNSRRRKSRRLSFSDAINELHDVLTDGLRFYQAFKADYERDVQRIRSYADPNLLDQLWRSKISRFEKRSSADGRHHGGDSSHEAQSQQSDMTFTGMAKDIVEGIHSTIDATRKVDRPEDAENAEIVGSKLGKTYKDLMKKLDTAPYRMKDTRLLMTELEMLLTFLSHNGAEQSDGRDSNEHYGHVHPNESGFDDQQGRDQYDEQRSGDEQAEGRLLLQTACVFILTPSRKLLDLEVPGNVENLGKSQPSGIRCCYELTAAILAGKNFQPFSLSDNHIAESQLVLFQVELPNLLILDASLLLLTTKTWPF